MQVLCLNDISCQLQPPRAAIKTNMPYLKGGAELPLVVLDAALRTADGPAEWQMVLKSHPTNNSISMVGEVKGQSGTEAHCNSRGARRNSR